MAYLKEIVFPRCPCKKKATVTLFNRFNAPVGDYCGPCGKKAFAVFLAGESGERAAQNRRMDEIARRIRKERRP